MSLFASRTPLLLLISIALLCDCKKCTHRQKIRGAETLVPTHNKVIDIQTHNAIRSAQQTIYFWPSLTDHERGVLRDAFHQIERRTCIKFNEQEYKPWYHADRWLEQQPYVLITKSRKYAAYSDNEVENVARRSILYITDKALNYPSVNQSRGMVIDQLLRFLGFRPEHLRPDAPSYIQALREQHISTTPSFLSTQLQWPFDPESVTIPADARYSYELTQYCLARDNADIGAGQRAGLLTRWDAIKINSTYCPSMVGYADPRYGPCVVPRLHLANQIDNNIKKTAI